LAYLEESLRAENHLVVTVQIFGIDTGDQLVVSIARALLNESHTQPGSSGSDALDRIRGQFQEQFTASQRFFRAAEVLERIIQLVIEANRLKTRAYIFLDGLDEAHLAGDVVAAVEELAEQLKSSSLVVTSRESVELYRLSSRAAFDSFRLAPLTHAESLKLVSRLIPERSLAEPLLAQLITRADGNPFFL